jgi:hypothetical protein
MPLWTDVTLYDICAGNVLDGGVHYRDVFDNNFPGIVWLHVLIRSLLGWSSQAIRLADLLFLTGNILLLTSWLKMVGRGRSVRAWTAVVLVFFYFSTSEYCHCQRDPWALLPALVAFHLRCRQVSRLAVAPRLGGTLRWAAVEGLCWGAVVWIKPQVMVAAFTCWLMSAVQIARASPRGGRGLLADLAGLLGGALIAGGLGIAWLHRTGAWPAFLEVMLDWNREYVAGTPLGTRLLRFLVKLRPWALVHVAAVPLALVTIATAQRNKGTVPLLQPLLAALYLGWLAQAILLQHAFDYQLVPPVLLGVTLLAGAAPARGRARWAILAAVLALAALMHPMLLPRRAATWPMCLSEGSTPAVRDRLALSGVVNWTDLEAVKEHLEGLDLRPGEFTAFDARTCVLYRELGLKPSTRFVTIDSWLGFYPGHRAAFLRALNDSHQRYVVTDFALGPKDPAEASVVGPKGPLAPPPDFPPQLEGVFPWSEPIVFRSGRYAVHRVTGPVKVLVPETTNGDGRAHD